jgi:eukaryotic-like serine/threonine-protein kinase
LRQIIGHCLEKEPARRFQTAQDVAFALRSFASHPASTAKTITSAQSPAALWNWSVRALLALTRIGTGALIERWRHGVGTAEAPILRYEAYSGFDSAPVVSPDGNTLAFTSTRDGTSRIWLKQLNGGGEAALTTGPDTFPRFHPDGASVLFIRRDGDRNVLFRQSLVGGEPRRLVADVDEADWSLDGRQIAMLRRHQGADNVMKSSLLVAAADGSSLRTVTTIDSVFTHPRWSPDGTWVAATEFGLRSLRRLALISVSDGAVRLLPDGKRLAFLGVDERGMRGIYIQNFAPERYTSPTRRPLAAFDADMRTESFAISPDGTMVVATGEEQLRSIVRADGLTGITRPRRSR